jgi:N-acetyl-gamma-glutamylphosphate reductase
MVEKATKELTFFSPSSTGVTGYVGGDALYTIYNAHPDWEITALVRNSKKAAPVAAAFPKVRFAYGSLEDSAVIEEEAAKADVVLRKSWLVFILPKSQRN